MSKTLFLGDIHGDWNALNKVLQKPKYRNMPIIQVGDLGLGFALRYDYLNQRTGLWEVKEGNTDPATFPERFKFIRGNHDSPEVCKKYPNYMGDYGFDKKTGIFHISGAFSIDKDNRTDGIDWWHDEELSIIQLNEAITLYDKIRPPIVVAHTCPQSIARQLLGSHKHYDYQRTEIALDRMFEIHKPRYWIFGHWHIIWRKNILGTDFICLPPNGTIELNI